MQLNFKSVFYLHLLTFLCSIKEFRTQMLSTSAPFNAPRFSNQKNQQSNIYLQPGNQSQDYKLSPTYLSMNNMSNSNVNNIDPFNRKVSKQSIVLNNPGYTNQSSNSFINMNLNGRGGGGNFSRLNLGTPLVNLHRNKGSKIIVLGTQNLRPNQNVYNNNMINLRGFPNNPQNMNMGVPVNTMPGGMMNGSPQFPNNPNMNNGFPNNPNMNNGFPNNPNMNNGFPNNPNMNNGFPNNPNMNNGFTNNQAVMQSQQSGIQMVK